MITALVTTLLIMAIIAVAPFTIGAILLAISFVKAIQQSSNKKLKDQELEQEVESISDPAERAERRKWLSSYRRVNKPKLWISLQDE